MLKVLTCESIHMHIMILLGFTKVFSLITPREDSAFLYFFQQSFSVPNLHKECIVQRADLKEGRSAPWWSSIHLNLALSHLSTAQGKAYLQWGRVEEVPHSY